MTRLGYSLPFGMFLWITWNTVRRGVMVRTLLTRKQSAKEGRKLLWSNAIMLISLLAIYGGLGYFYGWWGMLKYHGIPATIAMISGGLIITIQHANQHSLLYEKSGWTSVRGTVGLNLRCPLSRMDGVLVVSHQHSYSSPHFARHSLVLPQESQSTHPSDLCRLLSGTELQSRAPDLVLPNAVFEKD